MEVYIATATVICRQVEDHAYTFGGLPSDTGLEQIGLDEFHLPIVNVVLNIPDLAAA
jgi:hypothetical protein